MHIEVICILIKLKNYVKQLEKDMKWIKFFMENFKLKPLKLYELNKK